MKGGGSCAIRVMKTVPRGCKDDRAIRSQTFAGACANAHQRAVAGPVDAAPNSVERRLETLNEAELLMWGTGCIHACNGNPDPTPGVCAGHPVIFVRIRTRALRPRPWGVLVSECPPYAFVVRTGASSRVGRATNVKELGRKGIAHEVSHCGAGAIWGEPVAQKLVGMSAYATRCHK